MNTDEKLRAILRAEADRVEPSASGWDRIRESIAVRRRRRLWLRGSLAAATAMSLVAVVAVVSAPGRDDRGNDAVDVATQLPSPEPASPEPAETTAPAPFIDGIGVWPFTTQAEVDAWKQDPGSHPYLNDPDAAAEMFAREYLGIPQPVIRRPPTDEVIPERLVFRTVEGTTRELAVTKVTFAAEAPYIVASAKGGSVEVTSINADSIHGTPIVAVSPVTVAGQFAGVDQPIDVVLRAAPSTGGGEIARARAEVGRDGWTATLPYTTTARTGSLYVTTYSNGDGGLADAFAMPVAFTTVRQPPVPSPTPEAPMSGVYPAQFVGVQDSRIALFDTKTGDRLRYLTTEQPGGGASDPFVTDDGQSVVYVQGEGTCAASIRKVGVVSRRTEVLVRSKDGRVPRLPKVSSDGTLAYSWDTCAETVGDSELVVGDKHLPVRAEEHATIDDLDWSPDGSQIALVAEMCCDYEREIFVIDPRSAQRVDEGRVAPGSKDFGGSCGWTGVSYTFDNHLLATEACPGVDDAGDRTARVRDLTDAARIVLDTSGDPWLTGLDADHSGDHLLLGTIEGCGETCEDLPATVHRFSIDGDPVAVTKGVTDPVWVD